MSSSSTTVITSASIDERERTAITRSGSLSAGSWRVISTIYCLFEAILNKKCRIVQFYS